VRGVRPVCPSMRASRPRWLKLTPEDGVEMETGAVVAGAWVVRRGRELGRDMG
jgi:hypothetical protein